MMDRTCFIVYLCPTLHLSKMSRTNTFIITCLLFFSNVIHGHILKIKIKDENGKNTDYAAVALLKEEKYKYSSYSDEEGNVILDAGIGHYTLLVSKMGYEKHREKLNITRDSSFTVILKTGTEILRDVVVTAVEKRSGSSVSVIDSAALSFLQPTSFSDILELLPGGMSADPDMRAINNIRLRENGSAGEKYQTSSTGTVFYMDGAQITTNGALQKTGSSLSGINSLENFGKGVDMRAISTGDIASVKITRGIPSASIGNLTSGVIQIERRRGGNDIRARFKADMQSKLAYMGADKTFFNGRLQLNASADYVNYQNDPRDILKNFSRLTASFRTGSESENDYFKIKIRQDLDFGDVINKNRNDSEIMLNSSELYYTSNARFTYSSSLSLSSKIKKSVIESIKLSYSFNYRNELIRQIKHVGAQSYSAFTTATNNNEESEGIYPLINYLGEINVYGKPVNHNMNLTIKTHRFSFGSFECGTEWTYSKNNGKGRVYDLMKPPLMGLPTRPQPFYRIPADNVISFYAEHNYHKNFKSLYINTSSGFRIIKNMLSGQYINVSEAKTDPRININLGYTLENGLNIEAGFGFGILSMYPQINMLYPDVRYLDIDELNYTPADKSKRRVHFRTYVIDPANLEINAARNKKYEIRFGINKSGYRLDLSLYKEEMTDGFRLSPIYDSYKYNYYPASAVNPETITTIPELSMFPVEQRSLRAGNTKNTNGSATYKKGIEWTAYTPRFDFLNTRFTCSGAFFNVTYRNSMASHWSPPYVINNKNYPYIGLYEDNDGYDDGKLNVSIMADTYLKQIDMIIAVSFQSMVFYYRKDLPVSVMPVAYVDEKGKIKSFDKDNMDDPSLRHLIRHKINENGTEEHIPFAGHFNLKATKELMNKKLMIALFVNRIFNIEPDYYENGRIRRRSSSPYFGMEINFKI